MMIEEIKNLDMDGLVERAAQIKEELTAEDADLDALTAEAEAIEERKADIIEERKVNMEAVASGAGEVIETRKEQIMDNMEIRNTTEYINAFANYCKTGDDTECRSLLTDNTTNGVVPVPTFVAGIVAERLKASKILSRVRRMSAGGNVKVGFEIDAPIAGVHAEGGAAMAEEELSLGIVTLVPQTYKKWVSISDEALDSMSGEEYLRYIYDEVARGIVKAEEKAVIDAILAAPQTATKTAPAVAKTGAAAGEADDFVKARAQVSTAAEDLVVICSRAQRAEYKALVLAANYAIDPFDGMEVIESDYATVPIIGDLSGVMMNTPKGNTVEFKYDDKTRMKQDLVDILGRHAAAIGVVGNLFFCKVSA